jgi:hypothetical protein
MELENVGKPATHPAKLDGLVFFARRSSGPYPPFSQLKLCAEYMHQHWTAEFGSFDGSHIHIFGTQCARERLKAKHRIAFMDFVEALKPQSPDNRPRVELVVSTETGFLTNIRFFLRVLRTDQGGLALPVLQQHNRQIHPN